MDTNTLKQIFMGAGDIKDVNGHTDDIMSLGVSPDRRLVITGSRGTQPAILIWDSESMEIKGRTKLPRGSRAVSSIRFSKNGRYFFCSDKHNDSNVYCYDVQTM
jgi:WD40 repeat protein